MHLQQALRPARAVSPVLMRILPDLLSAEIVLPEDLILLLGSQSVVPAQQEPILILGRLVVPIAQLGNIVRRVLLRVLTVCPDSPLRQHLQAAVHVQLESMRHQQV